MSGLAAHGQHRPFERSVWQLAAWAGQAARRSATPGHAALQLLAFTTPPVATRLAPLQRDKKTKQALVHEGKVVPLTSHTLAPGARAWLPCFGEPLSAAASV